MFKRLASALLLGIFSCAVAAADNLRFQQQRQYQLLDFDDNISYADYQRRVAGILRKNWQEMLESSNDYPHLTAAGIDKLIDWHRPSDLPAKACRPGQRQRAMLLVHGLYDSPYVLHDLQAFFNQRCFHTRSILLPGHGTRPGNLLNISHRDWIRAVDFALDQLEDEVEGDVYITGFSTGAALALNQAIEQPDRVKGLFLFAPALKVADGLAALLRALGKQWVPYQRLEDGDLVKYESLTLDSVVEVGKLADRVTEQLGKGEIKIDIPVLLVVAQNDYTIKSKTAISLYQQGRFGNRSEMLVYAPLKQDGQCVKRVQPGDATAVPRQPAMISSCFVHQQDGRQYLIADYSHMALTLSSDDEHYGLAGAYRHCTHYFHDDEMQTLCKQRASDSDDLCFGERKAIGAQSYPGFGQGCSVVRRLTSNPQFDQLIGLLDKFISDHVEQGG